MNCKPADNQLIAADLNPEPDTCRKTLTIGCCASGRASFTRVLEGVLELILHK